VYEGAPGFHPAPRYWYTTSKQSVSYLPRPCNKVGHRATNLLDGCRTFGPENLLTETSDLKRRLDNSLEDLESVQGKYDKLRGRAFTPRYLFSSSLAASP